MELTEVINNPGFIDIILTHSKLAGTLALLIGAIICFATNIIRIDLVAIIVILVFSISGIIPLSSALSGFSDESVILIAALFVIGEGLVRTGIAYKLGDFIVNKSANSEVKVLLLLMACVGLLGAFMSSTGVVAIFIPVVLSVCRRMNVAPGKLMMPLSFAALISGMMTLVATAPNLVVNSEMQRNGLEGFKFFSITPLGLTILVVGIVYMFFARRFLVVRSSNEGSERKYRTIKDFIDDYQLRGKAHRIQIRSGSPMVDKTLVELNLRSKYGIYVVGIERTRKFGQKITIAPNSSTEMRLNDILLVNTMEQNVDIREICKELSAFELPLKGEYFSEQAQQVGMAEIMFTPMSEYYGKTLPEMSFRNNLNLNVVGIRRKGKPIEGNLLDVRISLGDTILVAGDWKSIRHMQTSNDVIVLNLPSEVNEVAPSVSQAPYALLSLFIMVALMVSGIVPNFAAAIIACLLMVLFKCVDMESAYRSIHWPSLILIIGMLPFATALKDTGGIDMAAQGALGIVGDLGPRAILLSLFVLSAITGLFISNTATAVLMAPVAISMANILQLSPYPFLMAVTIAASSAFMTPVSSPVNTLVLAPGNYKFLDFIKIGVPFTAIVAAISVILIPLLFPF